MKLAVAALALALVVPDSVRAGCACDAVYVMPHVVYQAGIFGGHCTLPPMGLLMARGRALALEQHVSELIERGELPDRKLHISFTNDWGWSWEPFAVSRNGHALFIEGSTALDERDLLRTIAYFGSPRWRSFHQDHRVDQARNEELIRRSTRILDREVGEPDLARFQARSVTVFQVGKLEIVYENRKLHYALAGETLAFQPTGFLPVQVGNRYVIQVGASVMAIEEGVVVASHPLPPQPPELDDWDGGRAEAHAKWVNFFCHYGRKARLTYSLEMNRFMAVDVEVPPSAYRRARYLLGTELFVSDCG